MVYVPSASHILHQSAAGKLHVRLESAFQTPGIIFTSIDAVIPNLIWISRARLAKGIDEAGHLTVAPELIVEILSPGEGNKQRDKEVKLKLYSLHGV